MNQLKKHTKYKFNIMDQKIMNNYNKFYYIQEFYLMIQAIFNMHKNAFRNAFKCWKNYIVCNQINNNNKKNLNIIVIIYIIVGI